jgi:tol-pal system protein YbgF
VSLALRSSQLLAAEGKGAERHLCYTLLVLLASAVGLSGCFVPLEQGARMERDIAALDAQVYTLANKQREQEEQLHSREQEADRQIAQVAEAMQRFDQLTRRADADFLVQLDEMIRQLSELRGQVEVALHGLEQSRRRADTTEEQLTARLDSLDERIDELGSARTQSPAVATGRAVDAAAAEPASPEAGTGEARPPQFPERKDELYRFAYSKLQSGQPELARQAFELFLAKWPDDSYSDNAKYWIGECYYVQKDYKRAIIAFDEVVNRWPDGDKADDALLKLGFSFFSLRDFDPATAFLEEFLERFPQSHLVPKAQDKLAEIPEARKRPPPEPQPEPTGSSEPGGDEEPSPPAELTDGKPADAADGTAAQADGDAEDAGGS